MRQGTRNRLQARVALLATLLALAGLAAASATSGVHITAGDVMVSMDVDGERGLHLRFAKANALTR